ncbi:phosphotransferase [Streptomyces sp. NPDC088745]|uniref:phosphotransferase n=1 Tax=Streptomyces sp. NPDC088745 TaxID=3365884 RepID=UPI0037F1FF99
MPLHADEVPRDATLVRSLLKEQCPQWADLPLSAGGAGTDNTLYRLGAGLLVRLPRTAATGRSVQKEHTWLPRLAPRLPRPVPEPVHAGTPTDAFPLPWSLYRWIDGEEAGPDTVGDWAAFGADLAEFVRDLRRTDLMGAMRTGGLRWYRGGGLRACDRWISGCFDDCRAGTGDADALDADAPDDGAPGSGPPDAGPLDFDALERLWRGALALPGSRAPHGWLHGDLKPSNLLVRDGGLHAVVDFGCLSVGLPDAEHAAVWDLPPRAREAYWNAVDLDDATWARARAWAVAVGVSGIAHYGKTFPAFVAECRRRLRAVLAADGR